VPRLKGTRPSGSARLIAALLAFVASSLLIAGASWAVPVPVGPIVITIPEGFEVAETQRLKKALIAAWTKSVRGGNVRTLLQINVIDFGSTPARPASEAELGLYSEKYLRQFLGGIERRRAGYTASPVAHIRLAGFPAARASDRGHRPGGRRARPGTGRADNPAGRARSSRGAGTA